MIKMQNLVPRVYYNSSRDFQLIGHLFDLVLNATKTEADLLFNLPFSINSDDQLLDLMTYTFGLRLNRTKYTSAQLRAVCSVAPFVMRHKGSRKAVETLCTALLNADHIAGEFSIEEAADGTAIWIKLSENATCYSLLQELLPYIMPAGVDFSIQYMSSYEIPEIKDSIGFTDDVYVGTVQPVSSLAKPNDKTKGIFEYNLNTPVGLAQGRTDNITLPRPARSTTQTPDQEE